MFVQFFIALGAFCAVVIVQSVKYGTVDWVVFGVAIALYMVSIFAFVVGIWGVSDYRTPNGVVFKPSFGAWCIAMHTPTARFLRDPQTGKWCWCKNVLFVRGEVSGEEVGKSDGRTKNTGFGGGL
jgi:hypothetical protein